MITLASRLDCVKNLHYYCTKGENSHFRNSQRLLCYSTTMKRVKFWRRSAVHSRALNGLEGPGSHCCRCCDLVEDSLIQVHKTLKQTTTTNDKTGKFLTVLSVHSHLLRLTLLFGLCEEMTKHFAVMSSSTLHLLGRAHGRVAFSATGLKLSSWLPNLSSAESSSGLLKLVVFTGILPWEPEPSGKRCASAALRAAPGQRCQTLGPKGFGLRGSRPPRLSSTKCVLATNRRGAEA